MSQFGVIRRNTSNRAADKVRIIQDQFTLANSQTNPVTDPDFRNKSVNVRSKVLIQDLENNSKEAVSGAPYYNTHIPVEEPDGNHVRLYHFFDHLSDNYHDYSGYDNNAELSCNVAVPTVDEDGPDLGTGMASRAVKFSGNSTNRQVLVIPESADLRILGLTVGFTLVIRFRASSITPDTGEYRRIWTKRDDANNYCSISVDGSGILHIHVMRAGVLTKWKTTATVVTVATWHLMKLTYNITGPAIVLYMDGASKTTTTDTDTIQVPLATTLDLFIGGWGSTGTQKGYWAGNIQFMFYVRDELYTTTQFGYINTNKWTGANIAFGRVAFLGLTIAI